MSGNYLTKSVRNAGNQYSSNIVVSNKFEILPEVNSSEMTPTSPPPPKTKEAEYQARIKTLEESIKKLNQSKKQWLEKEKRIEAEKSALSAQYEEFKKVSDSRNLELQRQIDALLIRVGHLDGNDQTRKKPKTQDVAGNSSSSLQLANNESSLMEFEHSDMSSQYSVPSNSIFAQSLPNSTPAQTVFTQSASQLLMPSYSNSAQLVPSKPASTQSTPLNSAHSVPSKPASTQSMPLNSAHSVPSKSASTQSMPSKSTKPPPIFVYGVNNYTAFSEFLKTHKVDNCVRKETNNSLILTTKTIDQFRELHKVLRTECTTQSGKDQFGSLQLHSYQLKCERAFIVFFRGVPATIKTDYISEALVELQYKPRRVVNVSRRKNGVLEPRPLFRIELEPYERNSEIYNLTHIGQCRMTVESFKPKNDPPLCKNCLRFGHTKQYCLRHPRCIKCGEDHPSDKCTLAKEAPCKCANCGESHPANYRGCSAFQKLRKSTHRAVDEIRKQPGAETQSRPPSASSFPPLPVPLSGPLPGPLPPPLQPPLQSSYAKMTRSSNSAPSNPPVDPMLLLIQVSAQVAQLTDRLVSIEKMLSPSTDWETVPSRRRQNTNKPPHV